MAPLVPVTEEFGFGFLMEIKPESYCLDVDAWCDDMTATAMAPFDPSDPEFGAAWVASNSLCQIAHDVLDQTSAMVVATGSIEITHMGDEGMTVNEVKLLTSLNSASLALSDSLAVGDPDTDGANYNFAYTDTDKLCDFIQAGDGTWPAVLCGQSAGSNEVLATAVATSKTVAGATGRAGSVGGNNADVHVVGSNIKKFRTAVNAAAETFSFSDSNVFVKAMTSVFLQSYSSSFSQTCYDFVDTTCEFQCSSFYTSIDDIASCSRLCLREFCDTGSADKDLNVTSVAESLGEAMGVSFHHTAFQFKSHITFEHNNKAETLEDMLTFGYDGQGWAGANSTVSCNSLVDTAPAPAAKSKEGEIAAPGWWGFGM